MSRVSVQAICHMTFVYPKKRVLPEAQNMRWLLLASAKVSQQVPKGSDTGTAHEHVTSHIFPQALLCSAMHAIDIAGSIQVFRRFGDRSSRFGACHRAAKCRKNFVAVRPGVMDVTHRHENLHGKSFERLPCLGPVALFRS